MFSYLHCVNMQFSFACVKKIVFVLFNIVFFLLKRVCVK